MIPGKAQAQNTDVKFTTLTTKDGLSANTVNAILKDRYGLLWIATEEGLSSYNGNNFKTYIPRSPDMSVFQSKEVFALHEDAVGDLWAGTPGSSLYLYNRKTDSFDMYPQKGAKAQLTNRFITAICSDHLGKLWVATMGGVNIVDHKTGRIEKLDIDPRREGGSRSENTLCVFEDKTKKMWIGTLFGLYQYDFNTRQIRLYRHNNSDARSLVNDTVKTIAQDKDGGIWIGTNNGLSRLSEDQNSFANYKYVRGDARSVSGNIIYQVVSDTDEHIWIGTEGGLDVLNIHTGAITQYVRNGRERFSINSRAIRCVYIDKNGIYWIGTYPGGINKFDKNLTLFNVKKYSEFDPEGLNAPLVTSFAEGRDGIIYVGTDGGGLNIFNPSTGLFSHPNIVSRNGINADGLPILNMTMDRHEQLWIGTFRNGLFVYDTRTGAYRQMLQDEGPFHINSNEIFCTREDRAGNMWIGTNGAGVDMYNPETKRFLKIAPEQRLERDKTLPVNGYIRAIEEDRQGNIWIGSFGSGIAVYNPRLQTFAVLDMGSTGFPINKILSLYEDRRGNMWIGTGGEGLFCYNEQTKKITAYGGDKGLPNPVVRKVLGDGEGNIWISTNNGIGCLNWNTQKIVCYNSDNGLQNNAFLLGAGFLASNRTLYFGGVEGFNFFKPSDIKINKNIPAVQLTSLKVDNKPVVPGEGSVLQENLQVARSIQLAFGQNFAISFSALNYTLPNQNRYAYRLKGFENSWNNVGNITTANYTNIDPGTYTFEVRAANNNGVWNNEGARITVIIRPPFYRTTVAYIFYIVLVGLSLYFIWRGGVKKLQRKFEVQQERYNAERQHELDTMKIKFLTNLSHEFRTPISLILAPADNLLALQKDSHIASQLTVIKRNAKRLLHLVNQLLDFRKMEEHELTLNLTDGNICRFLKDVVSSFQDLAASKAINLNVNFPSEPLAVKFDHDKIERIFFNLLSNAFKFTTAGGNVSVSVEVMSAESDPDITCIRIKVTDTGIGIPAEKLDKIFDRFFQALQENGTASQGSGIGLSITKEFVQMHGGTISVASKPEQGASFTVNLPLPNAVIQNTEGIAQTSGLANLPTAQPDLSVTVSGRKSKNGDLPTLLIVEDNDDFRFYLKDNLKTFYKVVDAANGLEGWNKALSCHPDIIVSDVNMPQMDGLQFSRKLKNDKRTSHIPVILLTALNGFDQQLTGLESGANDYLTKPFSFEILQAKVRNLLALNMNSKSAYSKQIKITPMPVDIESSSEKFLNNVVVYIDERLNKENVSIEDLASNFDMSRGTFYNRMLEITGKPPVEFIRSYKLDRAAVLLAESDFTITEIAYKVGFGTPHYFTKTFKAKFNMLPSEFRAMKREELKVN
ncbi:hybrid sensor histidine kinase/response regulator transcription factor [Mucilaginibacter sp.]|uniref:hybrid sensor histidine kinase/response regulator transcription factor n=1 Tax=Mucilaginibacter sp. TaxID=1882438 RepID=UPI002ED41347